MVSPPEQHSGMVVTRILPVPCPTHTTATSACTSLKRTNHGTTPYKIPGGVSRPGRLGEGVREFSCKDKLNFACERNREFPIPIPPRPDTYDPTPPQLNTCKSCQARRQRRYRPRMRLRYRGLRRLRRRRINPYFRSFLY